MKVALIQIHTVPNRIKDNVEKGIGMYRNAVEQGANVVAFPELWTCGYYLETPDFQAAVKENTWVLERFQKLAEEHKTLIILPLPQEKDGNLYIGLYVIEQDGAIIAEYQKSFLWGREQNYFVHGKREYEPLFTSVGKIGVLICYDIEFPEPSRILALKGAQLIFIPSVWSIPALNRWQIQLPARALDNTVFIAGINNVEEGACGHSTIISPFGEVLAVGSLDQEEVVLYDINYDEIPKIREKIPYLREYDKNLAPGKIDY